ncbi:MAG: type II secretion system major pseudopilin GspG [Verrucomicrobia bacterium]|nr:type II secretion system major pseudopilin GspG [Verrucomicrobiota bacterium]
MLIVIALIVVVAGLVVTNVGRIFGGGQEDAARLFVNNSLNAPLLKYRMDMGSYPTTEQGLRALMTPPANAGNRWRGPYIDRIPNDPWGNPYQYRYPGVRNVGGFDLWSLGPDGVESGDDIGNWDRE